MKKFFVLGLMCMCALMATAQNQERGRRAGMSEEERAKWYEELKKDLKLTGKQVDSLKVIDTEFQTKMREMRVSRDQQENQSEADRTKRREEMQKMNEKRTARIKAVLTEDQYKKYEEKSQARRQRGGGEGRPGGGQGRSGGGSQ